MTEEIIKRRRLKDILFNRADVVDKGDNKRANILIMKNEGGPEDNKNVEDNKNLDMKGVEKMTYEEIMKSLPKEQSDVILAEMTAKDATITDLKDKVVKEEPADDSKVKEVMKSADPETKAVLEKMSKQIETLTKAEQDRAEELDKSRKELRKSEFKKEAEKLDKIATNADELGDILMEAADGMQKESYDKLVAVLSAANEAMTKGGVFKEVGTNKEKKEGKELEELEIKAKEIAKQKGTKWETEYRTLIKESPILYKKYEDEKKGE